MATESMEVLQMRDFIKAANKRTFDHVDKDEPIGYPSFTTGQTVDQPSSLDHPAKRSRQTQEFFRPWLTENKHKEKSSAKRRKSTNQPQPLIVQYHPTKVRSFPPKERSPKEQQRRDRNTASCLLNRRAQKINEVQMQQDCEAFHNQHRRIQRAVVRLNLYLQELQRFALTSRMLPTVLPTPAYVTAPQPNVTAPLPFNCNCNYCK